MYGLICKEIEYVDSGFRSLVGVQSSLVMKTLNDFAEKEINEQYFNELQLGNLIGCFGLTESESGSNIAKTRTLAKLDGQDFILNGSKTWITNAPIADIFVLGI